MNTILEKCSCKDKSNTVQKVFNWIFVCHKCYIFTEMTLLKELMLIKQVHQKSVIFVAIWNLCNNDMIY